MPHIRQRFLVQFLMLDQDEHRLAPVQHGVAVLFDRRVLERVENRLVRPVSILPDGVPTRPRRDGDVVGRRPSSGSMPRANNSSRSSSSP
ncbi:MAG TPA: hypothetical protein EYQ83_00340 [Acidobacteria bacterium]|nr:hypothetical protein [Acidobacteriota bacterium]